jgi:hypothetical protein
VIGAHSLHDAHPVVLDALVYAAAGVGRATPATNSVESGRVEVASQLLVQLREESLRPG